MIPNLITDPTIHWVNSTDFMVSTTSTLLLSPLLTSHGGQYTCIVNINIIELDISLTGNGTTNVTVESKLSILYTVCDYLSSAIHTVPEPSVDISDDDGTPYNGSVYDLICTVIVDDNVDTNIIISSQWILPNDMVNDTISESISNPSELEQQHTLTFQPLRSEDNGTYTCNISITPDGDEFIVGTSYNKTEDVIVQSKYIDLVDYNIMNDILYQCCHLLRL